MNLEMYQEPMAATIGDPYIRKLSFFLLTVESESCTLIVPEIHQEEKLEDKA